ncbi:hypothetical protein Sjap_020861 [Stephania japonica]|uniref:Uncharacterized protein n=1 Tax=Stephania japonica TaxID=461633 RepID=A0AAP0F720_9MAGN
MTPNANKRKSFESKHIEERNRVNSRRRQLYAQLTQEEKDRRNYVRRVSYQKRSLQCIEKGSSSKQDGCVSNERLIDGLQKQRIIERNIGTEVRMSFYLGIEKSIEIIVNNSFHVFVLHIMLFNAHIVINFCL